MLRLLGPLALANLLLAATPARAEGTHWIIELNTGLGESAYQGGPMGISYGLSLGATFRVPPLPIRWYVLGTLVSRNATARGLLDGGAFSADRQDLDLYGALRAVLPVWEPLRVYGEVGLGQRRQWQTLLRGGDFAAVNLSDSEALLILAAGLQARLSEHFSLGLRGELSALEPEPGFAPLSLELAPTQNRTALFAQLGVHF